jgi:hypothetical protein
MLTPTALDPYFALKENKDAFGRPIYKEDRSNRPTPGYQRSRESATEISKALAEFLNFASSPMGTKYTKGFVSPTADEIDYLAGQYFGGVAREVIKGVSWAASPFTGEDIPAYRKPVIGKLFGETETPAAVSSKFYDNVAQMATHENELKQRRKNGDPIDEYLADNPDARFWKQANRVENEVSRLNASKKDALKRGDDEGAKRANDFKVEKMRAFNQQLREAR